MNVDIYKLNGENSQHEKERVIRSFKESTRSILICTDVASMGLDVKDLNLVINIGKLATFVKEVVCQKPRLRKVQKKDKNHKNSWKL